MSDAPKLLILIRVLHGTALGLRASHEHPARNHACRPPPPLAESRRDVHHGNGLVQVRRVSRGYVHLWRHEVLGAEQRLDRTAQRARRKRLPGGKRKDVAARCLADRRLRDANRAAAGSHHPILERWLDHQHDQQLTTNATEREKEIPMTQIKDFVFETTSDLRGGRQSWRVLGMLWSLSLMIAVTVAVLPH